MFLCAMLASRPASAAPRMLGLSWSAPPGCIDATALSKTVAWTLGRSVFDAGDARRGRVEGRVRAAGGQFEARVTLRNDEGGVVAERSLSAGADCRALDDSIAVVVALMVDSLEAEPAPLRAPERHDEPRSSPLLAAFGLGGGVTYGLLPGVASAAALRGELALPVASLSVSLAARVHAPSDTAFGAAGGTFTAWDGELALCPVLRGASLQLGACGGAGGGALHGSPTGVVLTGSSPVRPLVFLELLPYAALKLVGPVWLRLEGGILVPLLRESWGFGDSLGRFETLYRAAAVVPSGALTLELRTGS